MANIISENYSTIMVLFIGLIFVGIIIMMIPVILKKEDKELSKAKDINLDNEQIKKIDNSLDKEALTEEIFNLYKKLETAKSKYKYDILKEILTKDLYTLEEEKLKTKKAEKIKIVKTNIKLHELRILDIKKEDNIETILAYLHVSQYDYALNSKKELIRGTDKEVYQIELHLTIEKNKDKYFIKKKEITGKWIKNL